MFSRGGTLLPSIYADARYIDDVIVLFRRSVGEKRLSVLDIEMQLIAVVEVSNPYTSPASHMHHLPTLPSLPNRVICLVGRWWVPGHRSNVGNPASVPTRLPHVTRPSVPASLPSACGLCRAGWVWHGCVISLKHACGIVGGLLCLCIHADMLTC